MSEWKWDYGSRFSLPENISNRLKRAYLQSLYVFVDLTSFQTEFHCVRKDELDILRKVGARMVFLPFQLFLG